MLDEITDDLLALVARDDEHRALLAQLGMRAAVTAPLVARGLVLGALSFISAESGRDYGEADVQLLVELGRRAGVAVENARLYTERSRIAHTLQARLLPSKLAVAARRAARRPLPRRRAVQRGRRRLLRRVPSARPTNGSS